MRTNRKFQYNLWLLNIRGLNTKKLEELYNSVNFGENDLVCLTETHEKYSSVRIPDCYHYVVRRRDINDKKGGGLMIQMGKEIKHNLHSTDCSDLLFIDTEIGNKKVKVILVYMDVVSEERNIKIRKELDDILENCTDEDNIVVLGDFNGHLGFIGPQEINRNGRYVLEIMERYNLILLNGDDKCNGEITREENGIKSTIDFILVNSNMYPVFKEMEIDEDKKIYDLSDHCLIKLNLEVSQKNSSKTKNREIIEYFNTKDDQRDTFLTEFLNSVGSENINMEKFDDILGGCAERTLKKRFIKIFKENNKPEAVWFTTEMKDSIKLRRQYNRLVRNANNDEDKATFKILYDEQKRKTSMLIKEGISSYEIKITERLKQQSNSKDMWKDINKLRRREEDRKDTVIYDDEGKPIEKDKVGEVVCNYWRGIYQPDENKIHIAWKLE